MKRAVVLFSLFFMVFGCGDRAPEDSIVTGPLDNTTSLPLSQTSTFLIFRALDFKVTGPDGSVRPDVEIDFFTTGTAILSDITGIPLSNPSILKTKTDELGLRRVSVTMTVPGCGGGTNNVIATGGVLVTVGSNNDLWSTTITRTCTAIVAPAISTTTLPNGKVGAVYNGLVEATGGQLPYTWTAVGLPVGLSINTITGVISGTITSAAATFTVIVTVTDNSVPSVSDSASLTLIVDP